MTDLEMAPAYYRAATEEEFYMHVRCWVDREPGTEG